MSFQTKHEHHTSAAHHTRGHCPSIEGRSYCRLRDYTKGDPSRLAGARGRADRRQEGRGRRSTAPMSSDGVGQHDARERCAQEPRRGGVQACGPGGPRRAGGRACPWRRDACGVGVGCIAVLCCDRLKAHHSGLNRPRRTRLGEKSRQPKPQQAQGKRHRARPREGRGDAHCAL